MAFQKILIANRGEIACRIIRTCQDIGIRSVAVYSDIDKKSRFVEMADESYPIGGASAQESYLNMDVIIRVAQDCGADAIHPGYGFLSENADFAEKVSQAGMVFIGPLPDSIRAMGGKSEAKSLMEKAGVPLVPGYHEKAQDEKTLKAAADKIGFPVLIKASAGGGGKGMRVVTRAQDFSGALKAAKREAKAAFGNDHVLVEKYLIAPRHVEIQVFGDAHGNYVYLFERDCSLQRRHQKVVEEAPAPGMSEDLRSAMGEAAVNAAKAIDYIGAGTVEFLLNPDNTFYFMEMNTRLQVEHPVTEEITGQDLVAWQIHVAEGGRLPLDQKDLEINGHSIEVRLYAEDPKNDFLPAAGRIGYLRYPDTDGVRIESAVFEAPLGWGDVVSIHYDPMIAKIITHGQTRDQALERMAAALSETRLSGLKTNLAFLQNIILHPAFRNAEISTDFIERYLEDLKDSAPETDDFSLCLTAAALVYQRLDADGKSMQSQPVSPWDDITGWRQNGISPVSVVLSDTHDDFHIDVIVNSVHDFHVVLNDNIYEFNLAPMDDDLGFDVLHQGAIFNVSIIVDGTEVHTIYEGQHYIYEWQDPRAAGDIVEDVSGRLTAPMPGKIVAVNVTVGDSVKKGMPLVILEAMKMEHTISSPVDGVIKAVNAAAGDQVDEKLELVSFK